MMSGIKGKNTTPEIKLRKLLHAAGFRYRLHRSDLPGKPDIVLPRHKAVIFVNGCFWHGHGCSLFKWPGTNADFWKAKIQSNQQRDARALEALEDAGWRCLTVWECETRASDKSTLINLISNWIMSAKATPADWSRQR